MAGVKSAKAFRDALRKDGVFYTPIEFAERMKALFTNAPKTVYDPTCGDGNLLSVFGDDVAKYGQELDPAEMEKCRKRLMNFTGVAGNVLEAPAFLDMRFDGIIMNPPYSVKWDMEALQDDPRFSACKAAPKSKADWAFVLHALSLLADDGQIVALMHPGTLYRGNREEAIRKYLIESNLIDRIEHVEGGKFEDTAIATAIVVLKKRRERDGVVFCDGIDEKEVPIADIIENDYNLSVNRYVWQEVPKEVIDPIALEKQARESVYKQLEAQIHFSSFVQGVDPSVRDALPLEPWLHKLKRLIDTSLENNLQGQQKPQEVFLYPSGVR